MSTIGDDLLREASAAFGPRIEAVVVYNSNPVAVAPEVAKVVAGFAREDLFTVVLEHFLTDTADLPTTCCRPPRSWSTWTCTPATATPMR
jgi:anaerobic selenocysteine-containing dehydrogenase